MSKSRATKSSRRNILVILTNRWNPRQKPKFIELSADDQGNIHDERPLRARPRQPVYDEVWENDEGRADWDSCHRFSRDYKHPLQKRRS